MRDERGGEAEVSLEGVAHYLKYARVRPLEGRASWEAVWLRFISLCHTVLARGLGKLANDLSVFLAFALATCEGVYG